MISCPNGTCREMLRFQRWVPVRVTTEPERPRIDANKKLLSFLQSRDRDIIKKKKNLFNGVDIKNKSFKLFGKMEKKNPKLSSASSPRQQPYFTSRGCRFGRWQGARRPVTSLVNTSLVNSSRREKKAQLRVY